MCSVIYSLILLNKYRYCHHFFSRQKLKIKLIHYRQELIDPADPEIDGDVSETQANQNVKFIMNGVVAEDSIEVILTDRNKPKVSLQCHKTIVIYFMIKQVSHRKLVVA